MSNTIVSVQAVEEQTVVIGCSIFGNDESERSKLLLKLGLDAAPGVHLEPETAGESKPKTRGCMEESSATVERAGMRFKINFYDNPTDPRISVVTNVAILCYSVLSEDSLKSLDETMKFIAQFDPIPGVLVGTKIDFRVNPSLDVAGAENVKELTAETGNKKAEEISATLYTECSEETGQGCEDLLTVIIGAALSKETKKLGTPVVAASQGHKPHLPHSVSNLKEMALARLGSHKAHKAAKKAAQDGKPHLSRTKSIGNSFHGAMDKLHLGGQKGKGEVAVEKTSEVKTETTTETLYHHDSLTVEPTTKK